MSEHRRFFLRAGALVVAVAIGGIVWQVTAQEDGNQARGMITPATNEAIETGLAYLANQQAADGSFGTGQHQGNVAITSLGGLAFMAGGHQPGRGRYGQQVTNAVRFVVQHADRNLQPGTRGAFLHNPRASFHGPMYGHGFATLFLAEVYGMVNEPALRKEVRTTLQDAVQLIISTQNPQGGWRYRPVAADADLSVTICQIMALRAARNAGISVPKDVADRCVKYVKDCQDVHNSGGFRYQQHGGPPGFARTAAGVVALNSAGIYDGESVQKGLDYLMRFKPGDNRAGFFNNFEHQMHYFYGHYYAVQAMWIKGGNYWREWYPAIRNELLGSRRGDGSWDIGIQLGPHYSTAMALIILQVPNNYLPILQR
jgi:prenyltransferase beta subunit